MEYFFKFDAIDTKEIAPGFFSKLIHTDNNTVNFITVAAGCSVPLHQHMHQQISFVLEGVFELTIDGQSQALSTGDYAIIPPNVVHGGTAISNCRLIDIFSPARDDYRNL